MSLSQQTLINKENNLPPAARSLPPVAHASGSHTLTLPNNSLVLRGSMTDGDPAEVHYLWVRDNQSPAAGVSPTLQIRIISLVLD